MGKRQFETMQGATITPTIQLRTGVRTSMTMPGITMTTESSPKRVTAASLFEPNEVLNLAPISGFTHPIAATSFVVARQSIETPWTDVLSAAISEAVDYLEKSQFSERRW